MKLIKKFKIISIGVMTGFFIFEIGLKLIEITPLWRVFPIIEPILGHPDENVGFEFTPNAEGVWIKENRTKVKINSLGLRDLENNSSFRNSFKIFLTGDSMVEALQVEQEKNFENIAEKNLQSRNLNINISNLAKSGDGPLRQLINLENKSQLIKPDLVILFSTLEEFFSGELLDDSIAPGYIKTYDNKFVRGYAFRKRWQIKRSKDKNFVYILNKLQNYSVLRMIYFRMKEDFKTLFWKNEKKYFENNREYSSCKEKQIKKYLNLFNDESYSKSSEVFNFFLEDLSNSYELQKISKIYIINSIPIPNSECKNAIKNRQLLVNKLDQLFENYGIKFIDFNIRLNSIDTFNEKRIKFSGGHLNYLGHKMYSIAFSEIIYNFLKENKIKYQY
tara:strand:+ start:65 stop:1234 length:1170 start_codon:yes stop_codon:yes gene_type:complete